MARFTKDAFNPATATGLVGVVIEDIPRQRDVWRETLDDLKDDTGDESPLVVASSLEEARDLLGHDRHAGSFVVIYGLDNNLFVAEQGKRPTPGTTGSQFEQVFAGDQRIILANGYSAAASEMWAQTVHTRGRITNAANRKVHLFDPAIAEYVDVDRKGDIVTVHSPIIAGGRGRNLSTDDLYVAFGGNLHVNAQYAGSVTPESKTVSGLGPLATFNPKSARMDRDIEGLYESSKELTDALLGAEGLQARAEVMHTFAQKVVGTYAHKP